MIGFISFIESKTKFCILREFSDTSTGKYTQVYIYKYPSNTFHFIVSANMITYYGTIRSDKSCRYKWHKQSNHLGCANHSSLKIGTLHISTLWRSWNLAWRSRRNANHFCFQKVCFRKCGPLACIVTVQVYPVCKLLCSRALNYAISRATDKGNRFYESWFYLNNTHELHE